MSDEHDALRICTLALDDSVDIIDAGGVQLAVLDDLDFRKLRLGEPRGGDGPGV